jgi:hypothetical protein
MSISENSDLPLLERIQKYRDMALDARGKAETVTSQTARRMYIVLAEHWDALAVEVEQSLKIGTSD